MGHKRAFFALEDDAIGLQGLKFVPNILGDVYAVDAVFCAKYNRLNHRAIDGDIVIVVDACHAQNMHE